MRMASRNFYSELTGIHLYSATNFKTPCGRSFAFTSNTGTHTRGKSNDLSGLQLSVQTYFFRIKLTAHLHDATNDLKG